MQIVSDTGRASRFSFTKDQVRLSPNTKAPGLPVSGTLNRRMRSKRGLKAQMCRGGNLLWELEALEADGRAWMPQWGWDLIETRSQVAGTLVQAQW